MHEPKHNGLVTESGAYERASAGLEPTAVHSGIVDLTDGMQRSLSKDGSDP